MKSKPINSSIYTIITVIAFALLIQFPINAEERERKESDDAMFFYWKSEYASLKEKHLALEDEYEEFRNKYRRDTNALMKKNEELSCRVKDLEKNLHDFWAEKSKIRREYESRMYALQEEVNSLQSKLVKMENDNRDKIARAEESIEKYQMILDRLNEVTQEKADLENKLKEKEHLIALNEKSYQEGLRDLHNKNRDMERKRSSDNMQLSSDINRLEKQIEDLKAERQRNLEKIAELNREYNDKTAYYENEIKRLQALLEQKENVIAQQNRELENLRALTSNQQQEIDKSKSRLDELNKNFKDEISGGEVGVTTDDGRIVISLFDAVTFDSGSDELKPRGKVIINKIINALKDYPGSRIFVEGHTDNVPITKSKEFRDNWELSTQRALSVLYYILSKNELEPSSFVVEGYSEYKPIRDNDTPENRALNRRVNISILPKKKQKATEDEYK